MSIWLNPLRYGEFTSYRAKKSCVGRFTQIKENVDLVQGNTQTYTVTLCTTCNGYIPDVNRCVMIFRGNLNVYDDMKQCRCINLSETLTTIRNIEWNEYNDRDYVTTICKQPPFSRCDDADFTEIHINMYAFQLQFSLCTLCGDYVMCADMTRDELPKSIRCRCRVR